MKRRVTVAATALCALAAFTVALPAVAAGVAILPGQYRTTTTVAGDKAPTIRSECYTSEDIAEMFTLPESRSGEGACTVARKAVAGGRIDIARSCTGPRGVTAGSITGSYTPTGFTMRMQSRGPDLPAPLDIRTVAQRVGATCTDD